MSAHHLSGRARRILSSAVERWFEFYEIKFDAGMSRTLRNAALVLFNQGYHEIDDIATMLIGTFIGPASARVNAPSSTSIH